MKTCPLCDEPFVTDSDAEIIDHYLDNHSGETIVDPSTGPVEDQDEGGWSGVLVLGEQPLDDVEGAQ